MSTIWILDNGEENSDHAFEFVSAPDGFRMQEYLAARKAADGLGWFNYTAAAYAPEATWSWCAGPWRDPWDPVPSPLERFAGKPGDRDWVDWRAFMPKEEP